MKDNSSKLNYLGKITYQISKELITSLESSNASQNVGCKIGKLIKSFNDEVLLLEPFSEKNMSNDNIDQIIQSFNGYHLTANVSTEDIIEKCLKDKKNRSVMLIYPLSEICVNSIMILLEETIENISRNGFIDNLEAYPKLRTFISNHLIKIIKSYGEYVLNEITKYLEIEEDFFWSSDETFQNVLKSMSHNYTPDQVRLLVSSYYKTIISRARDYIVKQIVSGIIKRLERNINNELNILFSSNASVVSDALVENKEIIKERIVVNNNISRISDVILLTNSVE